MIHAWFARKLKYPTDAWNCLKFVFTCFPENSAQVSFCTTLQNTKSIIMYSSILTLVSCSPCTMQCYENDGQSLSISTDNYVHHSFQGSFPQIGPLRLYTYTTCIRKISMVYDDRILKLILFQNTKPIKEFSKHR